MLERARAQGPETNKWGRNIAKSKHTCAKLWRIKSFLLFFLLKGFRLGWWGRVFELSVRFDFLSRVVGRTGQVGVDAGGRVFLFSKICIHIFSLFYRFPRVLAGMGRQVRQEECMAWAEVAEICLFMENGQDFFLPFLLVWNRESPTFDPAFVRIDYYSAWIAQSLCDAQNRLECCWEKKKCREKVFWLSRQVLWPVSKPRIPTRLSLPGSWIWVRIVDGNFPTDPKNWKTVWDMTLTETQPQVKIDPGEFKFEMGHNTHIQVGHPG